MIDIIKQTPIEYSKQSRDYQVLARLYSSLFNLSKMYIDDLSIWNNNIDNKLTYLRSKTLNFETDHEWDLNDLEAVTACFKYLVMRKGTLGALITVINILLRVNKVDGNIDENVISISDNMLTIKLVKGVISMGVVEDLLRYIMPAGMNYRIIEYKATTISSDRIKSEVIYLNENEVDEHGNLKYIKSEDKPFDNKMLVGNSHNNSSVHGIPERPNKITDTFVYDDQTGYELPWVDKDGNPIRGDKPEVDKLVFSDEI